MAISLKMASGRCYPPPQNRGEEWRWSAAQAGLNGLGHLHLFFAMRASESYPIRPHSDKPIHVRHTLPVKIERGASFRKGKITYR